jgi:enoyl-CoA hydratase
MSALRTELRDGSVCVLTLDRPPANAIDESLLRALLQALHVAERDDAVRAIVLTGNGGFFSAGFDFSAPRRDDEVALELYELYRDAHLALLTLLKPTIAMIGGHAIAGGFVLALACDLRFAVRGGYRIGMNEVAVGASFPRAAFEIVRLRMTHACATELLLGAGLLPAHDAVRVGLAHEMLEADGFEEMVLARAVEIGAYSRQAYAHTKAAFVADAAARIRAESQQEAIETMMVWISDESRAARKRQREKLGVR